MILRKITDMVLAMIEWENLDFDVKLFTDPFYDIEHNS